MAEPTIKEQVDQAFSELTGTQYPFLLGLLSGLDDRLSKAEKAVIKGQLSFVSIWAVAYLISKGFVNEATERGLKLEHVQNLLVAVPLVLGFVSYSFSAALASALVFEETVREIYCKILPTLGKTNLDTLFFSHVFFGAEQHDVLTTRSGIETVLSLLALYGIVAFCWVVSLLAICHVSWMVWELHQWPGLTIGSLAAGCLLWFRGASMIYHVTSGRPDPAPPPTPKEGAAERLTVGPRSVE